MFQFLLVEYPVLSIQGIRMFQPSISTIDTLRWKKRERPDGGLEAVVILRRESITNRSSPGIDFTNMFMQIF